MSRRDSHREALEVIANKPSAFGVEGVIRYVAIESNCYDHTGKLIAQPDVVVISKRGRREEVTIFEYKATRKHERRAEEQLENARRWFREFEGYENRDISTRVIFNEVIKKKK